jgi:hypothetical protein
MNDERRMMNEGQKPDLRLPKFLEDNSSVVPPRLALNTEKLYAPARGRNL